MGFLLFSKQVSGTPILKCFVRSLPFLTCPLTQRAGKFLKLSYIPRSLLTSNLEYFTPTLSLTPTFWEVLIEEYSKIPTFSGRQHFYSYFQNPSENSASPNVKSVIIIYWATSWENLFLPYANNKGTDQPADPCSLISTFVISCLDTIISLVSIFAISWL